MAKRATVTIDDDNLKCFEKLKANKLTEGKGDLSFTSYMNACLSQSKLSVDGIIEVLKQRKKKKAFE